MVNYLWLSYNLIFKSCKNLTSKGRVRIYLKIPIRGNEKCHKNSDKQCKLEPCMCICVYIRNTRTNNCMSIVSIWNKIIILQVHSR